MGGGLEIALHCTYRTLSTGAAAVALPECFLGLVPGWGGTYLLPNLVGPAKALKVIIENPLSQNRMLRGAEAFSLGIVDALFEPADFLEESLRWAARVLTGAVEWPGGPAPEDATWDRRWRRRGTRRRQAPRRGARPVPGPRADRRGPRPDPRRGLRRRGRGARRPGDDRRAARQPVRLRPDPEARAAPGRRPGQVARPAGHQGRRRRRRPDGRAARAAVRAPAPGARSSSPTSTRPASTRASPTCTPRSTSCSSRGRISAGQGRPAQRRWSPGR